MAWPGMGMCSWCPVAFTAGKIFLRKTRPGDFAGAGTLHLRCSFVHACVHAGELADWTACFSYEKCSPHSFPGLDYTLPLQYVLHAVGSGLSSARPHLRAAAAASALGTPSLTASSKVKRLCRTGLLMDTLPLSTNVICRTFHPNSTLATVHLQTQAKTPQKVLSPNAGYAQATVCLCVRVHMRIRASHKTTSARGPSESAQMTGRCADQTGTELPGYQVALLPAESSPEGACTNQQSLESPHRLQIHPRSRPPPHEA